MNAGDSLSLSLIAGFMIVCWLGLIVIGWRSAEIRDELRKSRSTEREK